MSHPPIPEAFLPPETWAMCRDDIAAIEKLKRERNAIILAHNYVTPDIFYGVADLVGDSLALAREAARTQAQTIVVAGVAFMAETAKLLNPEKTVLMPAPDAGCTLADRIGVEDIRNLKTRYPGVPIVVYVNTSAAVKAECDICCTSANAKKVVESLNAPRVIMVPDRYLAENTAKTTQVEIIPGTGCCEIHARFNVAMIDVARQAHPGIAIVAHPECPADVVAAADFTGSTTHMGAWIEKEKPKKAMLVTEISMTENLALVHPETQFIKPGCGLCPYMKLITLRNLRQSLETLTTEVHIDTNIADRARSAVSRMMEVS